MACCSKLISSALFALLLAAGAEALSIPAVGFDKRAVDIDNLEPLGNNTLFEKWRPRYHFAAPAGWMNVSLYIHIYLISHVDCFY